FPISCSRVGWSRATRRSLSSLRFGPASALDHAVHLLDVGLPRVEADLLQDGHQGLAELVERLLRIPDVEDLELVAAAEACVIGAAARRARARLPEPPDRLVVLLRVHARRVEVDRERHR